MNALDAIPDDDLLFRALLLAIIFGVFGGGSVGLGLAALMRYVAAHSPHFTGRLSQIPINPPWRPSLMAWPLVGATLVVALCTAGYSVGFYLFGRPGLVFGFSGGLVIAALSLGAVFFQAQERFFKKTRRH